MLALTCLLLRLVLASLARGQDSQPSPTSTSVAYDTGIPSVWVPPSSTTVMPSLVFSSVPTLTACATAQVDWTLHNDTGLVNFDITLNVVEDDGQPDDLNMTLTKEDAMDPSHYEMNVTLPLGQYYFYGVINDMYGTTGKSNVFEVVQGQDSSCLNETGTVPPQTSTSSAPSSSSSSSGLPGGAIAGVVVGVLVVVAAVVAILLYRRRSKARRRTVDGAWIGDRFTPGLGSDMLYTNRVASPTPTEPNRRHLGSGAFGVSSQTLGDTTVEMSETQKGSDDPFASQEDDREVVGFAAYLRGR